MSRRLDTLRTRMRQVHTAEENIALCLKRNWPVGQPIRWEHGGHVQQGTVTRHADRRVEVNNTSTGKTYWVDAFHIVD